MVIKSLIENLEKPNKPKKINLIIDGGAFKGGYIYGALLYLKELEQNNYITIEKISGTSIGAIMGILYLTDQLEIYHELYCIVKHSFNNSLGLQSFYENFEREVFQKNKHIFEKLNNKLYINYYNIQEKKEILKFLFNSNEDVLESIKNTSYIPFLTDGDLTNNDNIDGFAPHLFYDREISNPKNLILNLHGVGTLKQYINTKNEKNCEDRKLSGILDVHHFFFHGEKTIMCSYLEKWKMIDYFIYRSKIMLRFFIAYLVFIFIFIKNHTPQSIKNNILVNQYLYNISQLFIDGFIYYILN